MIFTLEVLQALHGDSLLLHFGKAGSPQLIVIDGGPKGVYRSSLKPRLEAIRAARAPGASLPIRLMMVSHIDDDHIQGILDLTTELVDIQDLGDPLPYDIISVWHNTFGDIVGTGADALSTTFTPASLQPVSLGGAVPSNLPIKRDGALVLASVGQGRKVRDNVKKLGCDVNPHFTGLVQSGKPKTGRINFGSGLFMTVLGPQKAHLDELRKAWEKQVQRLKKARTGEAQSIAAAMVDDSVYNLSSLIVLAEVGGKKMLLTGDARGDEIIDGLKAAGLLSGASFHVDLFKVPHHGSDRNVSTGFFQQVTADHYVISADGKYGNPETATLQMISDARGKDDFTIHLTNSVPKIDAFFKKQKADGKKYKTVFRAPNALSIRVDLHDPI
jgi:hypothetical protein